MLMAGSNMNLNMGAKTSKLDEHAQSGYILQIGVLGDIVV